MRKYLVAAVLAATVAVLATAAFGSTKSPARQSSAGSALVSCGKQLSVDKPWPSDDDLERRLGKRPSTHGHSRQSLAPKKVHRLRRRD